MAVKHYFAGKTIELPGVYTQTKSGIKNPPLNLDYGTVLFIDTGMGAGYGGYSINGTLTKGLNAVKEYSDSDELQGALMGSEWSVAADLVFSPSDFGVPGASKVYYVSARTTTPAKVNLTFTHSGSVVLNIDFHAKMEGLIGNGVLTTGLPVNVLQKGFGMQMKAGPTANSVTPDKFILEFTAGTYTGLDQNGNPWFGDTLQNTKPVVIYSSPEFSTVDEMLNWINTSAVFREKFDVTITVATLGTVIVNSDLTANSSLKLFAGGTETYNASDLDLVLDSIPNLQYNWVMTDNYAAAVNGGAKSAKNAKVLHHLFNEARFNKFMMVAGGNDVDGFNGGSGSSVDIAKYYNTHKVVCVHGGFIKKAFNGVDLKYNSFAKTAAILGRICGLAPQTPATFKKLKYDKEIHNLQVKEQKIALSAGVLTTYYDEEFNGFSILQAVNTLQQNDFLVNPDGHSYEISVERINAQLERLIVINAKKDLLSQENGVNRFSLSEEDFGNWLKTFLTKQTSTRTEGNLINYFEGITVSTVQDALYATFRSEPNFPINKLMITNVLMDRSLQSL